jgi:hypothetical protein
LEGNLIFSLILVFVYWGNAEEYKKNTRLYELVTGWLPQECFSRHPVDDSTGKQPSKVINKIFRRSEKVTLVMFSDFQGFLDFWVIKKSYPSNKKSL